MVDSFSGSKEVGWGYIEGGWFKVEHIRLAPRIVNYTITLSGEAMWSGRCYGWKPVQKHYFCCCTAQHQHQMKIELELL